MRQCGVLLVNALLCGACGPTAPDDPGGTSGTAGSVTDGDATSESGGTTGPTTAADESSSGSGTTPGAGCPDADVPDADDCASHGDPASCGPPCAWFESVLFPACSGACGDAVLSGVCVAIEPAPETGCWGPCAKFWRELPMGLQVVTLDELCFDYPTGWASCGFDGPPECTCGCVPPP